MLDRLVGSRFISPRRCALIGFAGLLFVTLAANAFAQDTPAPNEETPSAVPSGDSETGAVAPQAGVRDPESYDLWVLAPAIVAILLAILMRQATPALAIGVVIGSYMMIPCMDPSQRIADNTIVDGLRIAFEKYVVEAIYEPGESQKPHILVILFTLIIGGMAGVISVNGGTRALVDRVARFASTSRRGQLTGWLAGLVVFFDDYSNTMIVGPTMRPMFDRLKISRAKLAYVVDSTAAPVASLVLIGTWVGSEMGYIRDGLQALAADPAGTPAFLANVDEKTAFIQSIPYRFYPILALWMVFVIGLLHRDFGPMRKSESRALTDPGNEWGAKVEGTHATSESKPTAAWLAVVPILILVLATIGVLYATGVAGIDPSEEKTVANILNAGDSYLSILYGGLAALTIAVVASVAGRACNISTAVEGALDGMARMLPALVILVLAWALSQVSQDLHLGPVIKARLESFDIATLPEWLPLRVWMPLSIFLAAAGVSFATGTSWATMGILTPMAVQISAAMAPQVPAEQVLPFFYASVGAVLAGSIFGDHCSPISDTTVLSSVASSCRVEEHVWTQMPYAVVTMLVAIGAGNVYCLHQNQPPWMGLLIGAGALLFIVALFGRAPKPAVVAPPIPPERLERRLNEDTPPPEPRR